MSTVNLKNSKNFKNGKTSKFDFILKGKKITKIKENNTWVNIWIQSNKWDIITKISI